MTEVKHGTEVSFKAVLTSKVMTTDPTGSRVVRLELVEERELPTAFVIDSRSAGHELMREIAPVVQQVMRSLPFLQGGRFTMPRLTIWLTEDEWDRLEPKPDIGDELIVIIRGRSIEIKPAGT